MADFNKATYREELVTIWRPRWNAVSLLGEGYTGSSLSGSATAPFTGNRGTARRQITIHSAPTMAKAQLECRRCD